MPRRASTKKRGDDEGVGSALRVVEEGIGGKLKQDEGDEQKPKNKHAQALSKLGASKGGKARAAKLSDRKRKEIAKKAATARWGKAIELA
jgi:hypothetical protein